MGKDKKSRKTKGKARHAPVPIGAPSGSAGAATVPIVNTQQARQASKPKLKDRADVTPVADARKTDGGRPVQTLLLQLASTDPLERDTAAAGIAYSLGLMRGSSEDAARIDELNKHGLVAQLIKAVSDRHSGTAAHACAALRNISLLEHDACLRELVDHGAIDITTYYISKTAEALLGKVETLTAASTKSDEDDEIKQWTLGLDSAITLCWDLSEKVPVALPVMAHITHPALSLLFCKGVDVSLRVTAAQCLQSVTEDCEYVTAALQTFPDAFPALVELASSTSWTPSAGARPGQIAAIRAATTGILLNLQSLDADQTAALLGSLLNILDSQATRLLVAMGPHLSNIAASRSQGLRVPQEAILHDALQLAKAQANLFEITANVFSLDDTDMDDFEDVDDFDGDDDIDPAQDASSGPAASDSGSGDLQALCEHLQAVQKVEPFCRPFSDDVRALVQNGEVGADIAAQLSVVQTRAFGCMTNLINFVSGERLNADSVKNLWTACFAAGSNPLPHSPADLGTDITGCMWSLARRLQPLGKMNMIPLEPMHVQRLCEMLASAEQPEELRINCAGLLACLGQYMSEQAASQELEASLTGMAQALIQAANADASLLVRCEAINAVFDTFAEPQTNATVTTTEMMPKLSAALASLSQTAQANKKLIAPDVRARVSETIINLRRFIKYKQEQHV